VDCEKFESLLIDELYGELDEVTSAAVRRHAAGCARCGALLSGLRATRKVAALPMEEPSADLEDRILSAVREQQKVLPFKARASSVLSRAGAWAMRPQTAMAAVFLLVIGTSFVLVQTRKEVATASKSAEGAPMMQAAATAAAAPSAYALEKESAFAHGVEERRPDVPKGMPSTAMDTLALAGNDGDRERDSRDKAKDEQKKNLDSNGIANAGPIGGVAMNDLTTTTRGMYGGQGQMPMQQPGASGGGGGSANMPPAPVAQQSQQANTGASTQTARAQACTPADANRYDQQHTSEGTLAAARCYRDLGNSQLARQRYGSLQSTPYATTAQQELDAMTPAAARKAAPAHVAAEVQAAPPRATATAPAQTKPAAVDQKAGTSY